VSVLNLAIYHLQHGRIFLTPLDANFGYETKQISLCRIIDEGSGFDVFVHVNIL